MIVASPHPTTREFRDWRRATPMLAVALLSVLCTQGEAMGTEGTPSRAERGSPPASASQSIVRPANADAAIARIHASGLTVVAFMGFSGAGYEDVPAVERALAKALDELDPASVLICAGATTEGIGVVYPMAKKRGFKTIGVV
ncbi:MAG: hypothetical protein ABW071_01190, partial [Casimicrobiaceae bacterium]